ncbi:MAG: hypothetical protein Aurels2KO_41130 [Aureliella sp.]
MQFDPTAPLDVGGTSPEQDDYATRVVDSVLALAIRLGASDVHLSEVTEANSAAGAGSAPESGVGIRMRLRIHGQLLTLPIVPDGKQAKVMGRLKALAKLITYRRDVPQEGRFRLGEFELRVGTLPTLHGERAVVRLQLPRSESFGIDQLGLDENSFERLSHAVGRPSGVIVISGPAGSGKTTTAYACLRHAQSTSPPRSIVTLEDPVESQIAGADQSQISAEANYDWELGLKSVLRQDPEVLMIGEIRDDRTAQVVFKAAATGQLVVTTLHSRSAADALVRLIEMGVPAHSIRSSLLFLSCQRLLPIVCECVKSDADAIADPKCSRCAGVGMQGRELRCETLPPIESDFGAVLSQQPDSARIHELAMTFGMQSLTSTINHQQQ